MNSGADEQRLCAGKATGKVCEAVPPDVVAQMALLLVIDESLPL